MYTQSNSPAFTKRTIRYSPPPKREQEEASSPALEDRLDSAVKPKDESPTGPAVVALALGVAGLASQTAAAEQVLEAPLQIERNFQMPESLQNGRVDLGYKTNGKHQRISFDGEHWMADIPTGSDGAGNWDDTGRRAEWLNRNEPRYRAARESLTLLDNTPQDQNPELGKISVTTEMPYQRTAVESYDGQRYQLTVESPRRLGRTGSTLDFSYEAGEMNWTLKTENRRDPSLELVENVQLKPSGEAGQHDYKYRQFYLKTGTPPLVNPLEVPVNYIQLD